MNDKEITKISKYNYGEHIDLDLIPIEDTNQALKEFSSGSRGLEICLRTMWTHGLKTYACYPGDRDIFDIGYIVMEENEDLFSYLSEELLYSDGIRISIEDNRQVIKFSGNTGEKNSEMILLAQNILTGRKRNSNILSKKIGEPFPEAWVRKVHFYDSNPNLMHWSSKVFLKKK